MKQTRTGEVQGSGGMWHPGASHSTLSIVRFHASISVTTVYVECGLLENGEIVFAHVVLLSNLASVEEWFESEHF